MKAVKGRSALQLGRDLDVQYKTTFVLAHKPREAFAAETAGHALEGEVEIDGAYFGRAVRPEKRKEDRKDRRLEANLSNGRRVVIVMRQRKGCTLTFVAKREADVVKLAEQYVAHGSKVYADEATHWDELESRFPDAGPINHSLAYSADGANTNRAKSFFARLCLMVAGQHHLVMAYYLHQYAIKAAWKDDNCRIPNGEEFTRTISLTMAAPVSRTWKGY